MKLKKCFYSALALGILSISAIPAAYAYFTTYCEAEGGGPIMLEEKTEITESFSEWTKTVSIKSDEGSAPVFVRARAFAGQDIKLTYKFDEGQWIEGNDGFYYYSSVLQPGDATSNLLVHIGNIPEGKEDDPDFNVVVVYECTPVQYDDEGNLMDPQKADWSVKLDTGFEEGGES